VVFRLDPMRKVLVICAHPDDESLGCGSTMLKHISQGDEVYCLVLTDNFRSPRIFEYFAKAAAILGITDYKLLKLPDSQLEKYTRMELAQEIEKYTQEIGTPDIIYTHHPDELSQDHRIIFWAALTAFRPVWDKVFSIYSFDSPSSTEWSTRPFVPNMFVDIGGFLEKKIEAIKCYETELRDAPHPRSIEALESRARYWGSHCGVLFAEAFEVIREIR